MIEQGSTDTTNFSTLLEISINTLTIAGISAIIIVFISAFLALTVNFKGNKIFPFFATAAGSGYAFPGVMIALGTTYFFSLIQFCYNNSDKIDIDLIRNLAKKYKLVFFKEKINIKNLNDLKKYEADLKFFKNNNLKTIYKFK